MTEQLRISRQLTDTKQVESDSDEDNDNKVEEKSEITENFRNFGLVGDNSENPWLLDDGEKRGNATEERVGSCCFLFKFQTKNNVKNTKVLFSS